MIMVMLLYEDLGGCAFSSCCDTGKDWAHSPHASSAALPSRVRVRIINMSLCMRKYETTICPTVAA